MARETMARTIRLACAGSRMAPLAYLRVIQGDLKELTEKNYAKLRQRIETKGFDAPLFVWQDMILDGTQRYRVLQTMLADGWDLPGGLVPVCDIEAEDLEEAKDRLLGYVSQYGRLTESGLTAFLDGVGAADLDTLVLPGFDPGAHPGAEALAGGLDLSGPAAGTAKQMQVMCPECGYEFIIDSV